MSKQQAIENYINYITSTEEYKRNLDRVINLYWSYYSEADNGSELAFEHWKREMELANK